MGDLRSSDLWVDNLFIYEDVNLQPLDLVLFSKDSNSFGAHVDIYIGKDKILLLSEKEGKPLVLDIGQFRRYQNIQHFSESKDQKLVP